MSTFEIEKKFLIHTLPDNLESFPSHHIEQGYLCTNPVVRIRKQDSDYFLTYKGKGLMVREEYNLPLTQESYLHLKDKVDGIIISKQRFKIPYCQNEINFTIELDIFHPPFASFYMAEVEFESKEDALAFIPPSWFGEDVTLDSHYHNSTMSKGAFTNSFDISQ